MSQMEALAVDDFSVFSVSSVVKIQERSAFGHDASEFRDLFEGVFGTLRLTLSYPNPNLNPCLTVRRD